MSITDEAANAAALRFAATTRFVPTFGGGLFVSARAGLCVCVLLMQLVLAKSPPQPLLFGCENGGGGGDGGGWRALDICPPCGLCMCLGVLGHGGMILIRNDYGDNDFHK